jgi:acetyl esterase/lipase
MKNQFLLLSILLLFGCIKNDNPGPTIPLNGTDTAITDLAYGTDPRQKMDIYLPNNRSQSATKVIILIHGGAWSGGDKSDLNFLVPLIQEKWPEAAIANVNYRWANGTSVTHTQISADIAMAVQHLAANKTNYNISTNMGMIGGSAGAHLGLLYAYRDNTENFVKAVGNVFGPSYFADWDYYNSFNPLLGGSVKEVYRNYVGTYWETALYQSLSPYHIVSEANYVPTITFHGTADLVVPIHQSQFFVNRLNALGLINEYYEYTGQGHGFDNSHYRDCIDKTITFFKNNL